MFCLSTQYYFQHDELGTLLSIKITVRLIFLASLLFLAQAIEKFKASAAALNRSNNAKSQSAKELPKPESSTELNNNSEPSIALPTHRSSTLPPDFFDKQETKRQKNGKLSVLLCVKVLVEDITLVFFYVNVLIEQILCLIW